jgi:myosin-crossreactive antigen
MPWYDGIMLINKAYEEKDKDKAWQIWLVNYQDMTQDNFKSFEKFYNELHNESKSKAVIKTISVDEIKSKAEKIKQNDKKRNHQ